MAGRSTLELLPPAILARVHKAIVEGATIDEIVRRIRANGGTCSRSAVVRYVKAGAREAAGLAGGTGGAALSGSRRSAYSPRAEPGRARARR